MRLNKQNDIKKSILKRLKDKNEYFSYVIEDNEIKSIIIAGKENELGEVSIYLEVISDESYINDKIIIREIKQVIDFYNGKIQINRLILCAYSSQKKLLKLFNQLGFEFKGNQYIGFVKDALKYYKNIKLSNSERISIAKVKDGTEIIKLVKISHDTDKTCRLRNLNVNQLNTFKEMIIKDIKKNKSVFIINGQNHLIGYIWLLLRGESEYLIAGIAVHPDYWGQGIANILYKYAFKFMNIKGIKKYYGVSSTKAVMKLAEKLNRKIYLSAYHVDV